MDGKRERNSLNYLANGACTSAMVAVISDIVFRKGSVNTIFNIEAKDRRGKR